MSMQCVFSGCSKKQSVIADWMCVVVRLMLQAIGSVCKCMSVTCVIKNLNTIIIGNCFFHLAIETPIHPLLFTSILPSRQSTSCSVPNGYPDISFNLLIHAIDYNHFSRGTNNSLQLDEEIICILFGIYFQYQLLLLLYCLFQASV